MRAEEERLTQVLAIVCDLESDEAIQRYVEVIDALRGSDSEDVLRRMLGCLRDTDAGEVQYELVEACEAFPHYVRVFFEVGLAVVKKAPRWFRLMFQSILNSPAHASQALMLINEMDGESRAEYKRIIEGLSKDTPQYAPLLNQIQ
ncbi:MAG: hypothetical protein ABI779_26735 [Acidobacteriota bacterium]